MIEDTTQVNVENMSSVDKQINAYIDKLTGLFSVAINTDFDIVNEDKKLSCIVNFQKTLQSLVEFTKHNNKIEQTKNNNLDKCVVEETATEQAINNLRQPTTKKIKITASDVDSSIKSIFIQKLGKKTTVALITLQNGFEIVASSSCVTESEYNETIGREIAINRAKDKVWELLGFALQQKNYEANMPTKNDSI